MKNFKLLLATTAMLSMSSMVANALSNQDTVDVTIEMVSPAYVITKTDMNLGKVAHRFDANNTRLAGVLNLKTDGTVSETDLDYYGGANVAVVQTSGIMTGKKLAFPDEVEITKGTGEDKEICGTLKEIVTDGGNSGYGDHHIGGKFYINTSTTTLTNITGSCTGSFTVTAVIDDGQGS